MSNVEEIAKLTADAEYCAEMRSGSNNPEYWAESENALLERIAELEMKDGFKHQTFFGDWRES